MRRDRQTLKQQLGVCSLVLAIALNVYFAATRKTVFELRADWAAITAASVAVTSALVLVNE